MIQCTFRTSVDLRKAEPIALLELPGEPNAGDARENTTPAVLALNSSLLEDPRPCRMLRWCSWRWRGNSECTAQRAETANTAQFGVHGRGGCQRRQDTSAPRVACSCGDAGASWANSASSPTALDARELDSGGTGRGDIYSRSYTGRRDCYRNGAESRRERVQHPAVGGVDRGVPRSREQGISVSCRDSHWPPSPIRTQTRGPRSPPSSPRPENGDEGDYALVMR
ncbi:hypothetical protein B0H17DRAFT_1135700 [Mycena rosella]|uniref:Uncharacterized protein n=1 Tax=Mycena rosella TaxID=1033263 RepID=A0AAD7DFE7_MYCRO|nr:hypothetical protein B0H17DRAFT_1135700 [Mycena rosella]